MQLFRNVFVFYDKEIEDRLAPGETIITYISNALKNQCFPQVSRPAKIVKNLMAAIATIKAKQTNSLKTKDCILPDPSSSSPNATYRFTLPDFVRHFVSEHLVGAT